MTSPSTSRHARSARERTWPRSWPRSSGTSVGGSDCFRRRETYPRSTRTYGGLRWRRKSDEPRVGGLIPPTATSARRGHLCASASSVQPGHQGQALAGENGQDLVLDVGGEDDELAGAPGHPDAGLADPVGYVEAQLAARKAVRPTVAGQERD